MKNLRPSLLLLALAASTLGPIAGCASAAEVKAPAPVCHVDLKVDWDSAESPLVDLGPHACDGSVPLVAIARPGHAPDAYLVKVAIAEGDDGRPRIGTKVATVSSKQPNGRDDHALVGLLPPLPPGTPEPPMAATTPIAPDTWVSIGDGQWPEGDRYRVSLRVRRGG